MDIPYQIRHFFTAAGGRCHRWLGLLAVLSGILAPASVAQSSPVPARQATVQVSVSDTQQRPAPGVVVVLAGQGGSSLSRQTDERGIAAFTVSDAGRYSVSTEQSAGASPSTQWLQLNAGEQKRVGIVLERKASGKPSASGASAAPMEFADQPNFTIAGVTDWTAVGGHGADTSLRASEALTRETVTLKSDLPGANEALPPLDAQAVSRLKADLAKSPRSFTGNHELGQLYANSGRYREALPYLRAAYETDPDDSANEYSLAVAYQRTHDLEKAGEHLETLLKGKDTADLHRLSGDIAEQSGDSLTAVHEYEHAVRLDASEDNYFAWGSELLLHRAVGQAQQVFEKGVDAYPKSPRMITALGSSLFAGGRYDDAAARLCEVSDLKPVDAASYIALGKIDMAAPNPLACVEQRLARFVEGHPDNSLGNYYYARTLLKAHGAAAEPRARVLLAKATALDPYCAEGYLQLGILAPRQEPKEAIDFYLKAIEADPQLGEAYYRLGVAYDRAGESERAKQAFQKHDEIERRQAEDIERQRRELKQFLVVLQGQPN